MTGDVTSAVHSAHLAAVERLIEERLPECEGTDVRGRFSLTRCITPELGSRVLSATQVMFDDVQVGEVRTVIDDMKIHTEVTRCPT